MKTSFGMEIDDDYWQRRHEHLYNYKARIELVEMIIKLEQEYIKVAYNLEKLR